MKQTAFLRCFPADDSVFVGWNI